jgi:membrane fusion protein (multidrug efflux system)
VWRATALIVAGVSLLVGCGRKQGPEKPAPGPTPVSVITLALTDVKTDAEFPGRATAYRVAEVRPQVNGVILKRMFVEGAEVKAGQQLYLIDPAPYEAALASAEASLLKARATQKAAALQAQRYKPLAEVHAVSGQDYDNAVSSADQANADIASAQASVKTARINLTYTRVLSPISGRTGRSSVTEGALVTADQATSLVTVQQLDPIYIDVTQPAAALLKIRSEIASGALKAAGKEQTPAHISLEDGSRYPQAGTVQFSEVTVDETTGSVTLRALFPNPARLLLPGMFVRETIDEGVRPNSILIPQRCVIRDSGGRPAVMRVGEDGKVHQIGITTARTVGNDWLVTSGVQAGDKVVVEGLQKIHDGGDVQASDFVPDDADAAPPADGSKPAGNASSAASNP